MHVVAATPLYPPASRVGAWLATHECLAALVRAGHTVDVVAYMAAGETYELDGVTVHDRALRNQRLIDEADLLVSHSGDNGKAHTAARARGIPSVKMVHGHAAQTRLRLEGATLAVFNSYAALEEVGWDGPSTVIRPAVWPDRHRTTPGDRVTLVNLSKEKGGHQFYVLARSLRGVSFLGVKGGYGRQRAASGPLPPNLEIVKTTANMRDDVWARTRVLVMPSSRETYGMVGLEAMASGIPVVAHPTEGLLESLGDAATFIDRDRLGDWKLELLRLVENPAYWQERSAAALARVAELDPEAELARFVDAVEAVALEAAA